MSKTLVLIRHAKSSWANPGQADHDRPLNERGKVDAPVMAARIKFAGMVPQLMCVSTAKRAQQTAKAIAKEWGMDIDTFINLDKLYHSSPQQILDVVADVDDQYDVVAVVAHNPGLTELADNLSPQFSIDNLPTCGIVAARSLATTWKDFRAAPKQIVFFDYPKKDAQAHE